MFSFVTVYGGKEQFERFLPIISEESKHMVYTRLPLAHALQFFFVEQSAFIHDFLIHSEDSSSSHAQPEISVGMAKRKTRERAVDVSLREIIFIFVFSRKP